MESFHWGKQFETGLTEVDRQHHFLVDLINRFGDLLTQIAQVSQGELESVLDELADYAHYHFEEEESLMRQVGLDARHFEQHLQLHGGFLKEVTRMREAVSTRVDTVEPLLRFLIYWLASHILGTDQSMARQIRAIEAGQKPEAAYLDEKYVNEGVIEPLLNALNGLFHEISERNRELLELNRTLEAKVVERTRSLSEANHLLEEMALTDVLTGLPNRRHAMASFIQAWARSSRAGSPLACMMIDADGFKQINDRYGHDAGDEVLRQLSRQLRDTVRTDDVVCRLGGDEFLIICPGTALEGALQAAETVRREIAQLHVPMAAGGEWAGSISVGVAARTAIMQSHEDLIKAADEGVYIAKRNGRNRVACRDAGA
ncbi:MAG: GGDEF domain-containing protein [Rhodocyclaceae bacterium]|nr:MAG: GGDEF domain-containing protein [Rhodocyclaceae bacterium]